MAFAIHIMHTMCLNGGGAHYLFMRSSLKIFDSSLSFQCSLRTVFGEVLQIVCPIRVNHRNHLTPHHLMIWYMCIIKRKYESEWSKWHTRASANDTRTGTHSRNKREEKKRMPFIFILNINNHIHTHSFASAISRRWRCIQISLIKWLRIKKRRILQYDVDDERWFVQLSPYNCVSFAVFAIGKPSICLCHFQSTYVQHTHHSSPCAGAVRLLLHWAR